MKVISLIIFGFLITSLVGLLDSFYLTIKHYFDLTPVCFIFEGCERVLTSPYAVIFNVPISLFGIVYYSAIFILVIVYLDTRNEKAIYFAAKITPIGFLLSLFLTYLQIFAIRAICIYCLISALSSTILFILGVALLKLPKIERRI